jgi:hypothetical protein
MSTIANPTSFTPKVEDDVPSPEKVPAGSHSCAV